MSKMKSLTKAVLIATIVITLLGFTFCLINSDVAAAALFGDVNGDGIVNSKDLSVVQKIILGKYEPENTVAPEATADVTAEPVTTPSNNAEPPEQLTFKTTDEFTTWLMSEEARNTKLNKFPEMYKFYNSIDEDGCIYVPYYEGNIVNRYTIIEETELLQPWASREPWWGYDYRIENIDGKGTNIRVEFELIDEKDIAYVEANFPRCYSAKFINNLMTDEEFEEGRLQEITANIGGVNTCAIYAPSEDGSTTDGVFFLHDGTFVFIRFYCHDEEIIFDILEKLTIEKILLPTAAPEATPEATIEPIVEITPEATAEAVM